jgi:hypothetical protein
MSRKRSGNGYSATPSIQRNTQPDTNAPDSAHADSGAKRDRFRANVFTWTGPGVENIFIDFEPALGRKRRRLWNDGVADGRREASEPAESNG